MEHTPSNVLRERLFELIEDPAYRRFVFGYLLSCLDERHWSALIQASLEHVETIHKLAAEQGAAPRVERAGRG